jgi:hypothetical protein
MLPVVLLETPQNDADFDLDVRLQDVQYRLSANHAPTSVNCTNIDCSAMGCPTGQSACQQSRWQD